MSITRLFAGIVIMHAMATISGSVAAAESMQHHGVEQKQNAFLLSPTPVTWPQSNSGDPSSSRVKVTISRANVQTPYCVRINHIIICFLEVALKETDFDHSKPQIHITLSRFFLNLFSALISPNAP